MSLVRREGHHIPHQVDQDMPGRIGFVDKATELPFRSAAQPSSRLLCERRWRRRAEACSQTTLADRIRGDGSKFLQPGNEAGLLGLLDVASFFGLVSAWLGLSARLRTSLFCHSGLCLPRAPGHVSLAFL